MAKKLLSSCLPVKSATGIVHEVATKVVSVLVGDFKACVVAEGRFRLVAAVHLRGTNDCCYRKQSLPKDFREGPLYPLKLPVESDHCQVTALACADLVLSTQSGDLN